jgi:uncharacterized protein (TIGR03086 family)
MTSSAVDQLGKALTEMGRLVAGVRDDQWTAPTPCTEWDVRDLVGHVVAGNLWVGELLGGGPPPAARQDGALLGEDPLATYRQAADAVLGAASQPGALERPLTLPIGEVPGVVAVYLRLADVLAHGWDLARATGQQTAFPDDVVEEGLRFSQENLPKLPRERLPFAPPQPVPDGAPAIDRLAGLLGRPVAGSAT